MTAHENANRFKLTDEELDRVSGGFTPIDSDPGAISHYEIVYLIRCEPCDWRGLAFAESEIPTVCPACGVLGGVVVHNTDTFTDDYDLSMVSSHWLG